MINIVIIAVIASILVLSISYIVRAKKRGVKCIGCPSGGSCTGNCSCCSDEVKE